MEVHMLARVLVIASCIGFSLMQTANAQQKPASVDEMNILSSRIQIILQHLKINSATPPVDMSLYPSMTSDQITYWLERFNSSLSAPPAKEIAFSVHASRPFSSTQDDPPCGESINGGILPPGYAHCVMPCVELPPGTKPIKVIMYAKNRHDSGYQECTSGSACPIWWSKWWSTPEIYEHKVCGHFKNWSHDTDRDIKMVVQYQ